MSGPIEAENTHERSLIPDHPVNRHANGVPEPMEIGKNSLENYSIVVYDTPKIRSLTWREIRDLLPSEDFVL